MFKYKGRQCVIEYQCTPIASEYVKRHDLYKAAGIIDIWILGKYNYCTNRVKMIEKFAIAYYENDILCFIQNNNKNIKLNDLKITDIIQIFNQSKDKLETYLAEHKRVKECNQCIVNNYSKIPNELSKLNSNCTYNYINKKSQYYSAKMYCNFRSNSIKDLTVFIKPDQFDVCYYNGSYYCTIYSVKYDTFDITAFEKIITMIVSRYHK